MNHEVLVRKAERWLRSNAAIPYSRSDRVHRIRCGVVLTERYGYDNGENPDAIGWAHYGKTSILVECKASRSDFLADKNKKFRQETEKGIGNYRYYLAPKGIIGLDDLPPGWGLLELPSEKSGIRVIKLSDHFKDVAISAEKQLLYSELQKYHLVMTGQALWPCKAKLIIENTVAEIKRQENDEQLI